MKAFSLIAAASALCLASAAQARMPVFLELDGVKGETTKAQGSANPEPAADIQTGDQRPEALPQATLTVRKCGDCGMKHGAAAAQDGMDVASKEKDEEGALITLLLPARQGPGDAKATSTQGPYQLKRQVSGQPTKGKSRPSESISLNYPKPKF